MQFWQCNLQKNLQQLKNEIGRNPKIAILGIGSELNGDDAAGVFIVRRLIERYKYRPQPDDLIIFDCGSVPENFSGPLRRFNPDFILIIDAGSFGEAPGEMILSDYENTDGMSFSTHSLPPSVFAEFLINELGCMINLLLIQAENVEYCHPLNEQVSSTIRTVINELDEILINHSKESAKTKKSAE